MTLINMDIPDEVDAIVRKYARYYDLNKHATILRIIREYEEMKKAQG